MSPDLDLPPPRGLPDHLPEGEHILWQGSPDRAALARRALKGRLVVIYFGLAMVFVSGIAWSQGRPPGATAISLALLAAACGAALALIWGFAVLVARTTIYTITTRRVVMRIGIALPITLNLPLAAMVGAGLRTDPDGTGDIPIAIGGAGRIGFFNLWPHARPWRVSRPEPMLRAVPEAAQVGAILARALGAGPLGRAATARVETPRPVTDAALPSAAA